MPLELKDKISGLALIVSALAFLTSFLNLYLTQIYHSHRLSLTVSSLQVADYHIQQIIVSASMILNLTYTNSGTDDEVIITSKLLVDDVQKNGSYDFAFVKSLPPKVFKAGEATVIEDELPTSLVLGAVDREPELPGPSGQPLPEFLYHNGTKAKVGHHSKATIFIRVVIIGRKGPVAELLPVFSVESDYMSSNIMLPHYLLTLPKSATFSLRDCRLCFLGESYGPRSPPVSDLKL